MPWDVIAKTLGLGAGGIVRSGFDALLAGLGFDTGAATPGHQRATFTIAFIALAAKMAKADGCVSPIEAQTFAQLYKVDPAEAANVKRVFDLAAGDTAGYETYARQIAQIMIGEPLLLRDVFDGLFAIAAADGVIHPGEDLFLRRVADIFGITGVEFGQIRAAFVRGANAGAAVGDTSPYDRLGVDPQVSDADLKSHYRALVRDHHPDSLAARGVPSEFHSVADRKLAVINAAYDEIMKLRGRRVDADRVGARS